MLPKLLLIVAATFGISSVLIWFTFLRPVPTESAVGVIRNKWFKPAGEYWRQPAGQRSDFWAPNRIPIAECYVFEIQVKSWSKVVGISLNTVASRQFEVGQQVTIEYQERGVPVIWKRVFILNMAPRDG